MRTAAIKKRCAAVGEKEEMTEQPALVAVATRRSGEIAQRSTRNLRAKQGNTPPHGYSFFPQHPHDVLRDEERGPSDPWKKDLLRHALKINCQY